MLTLLFLLLFQTQTTETRLVDLRGQWLFRVGDNPDYSKVDVDESRWSSIFVPASWEDEGFPGMDGIHWYRITVTLPRTLPAGDVYLDLGRIDDSDETFFNGEMIGRSGTFPPFHSTAYHLSRSYRIPHHLIRKGGENVIAVRVYDDRLNGGILEGRVGIYVRTEPNRVADLSGLWSFQIGDDPQRSRVTFDDHRWKTMMVPQNWSQNDFSDYDGFAWYRHRFHVRDVNTNQNLWLVVGKIDDADETWLNGVLLGGTGSMRYEAYDAGEPSSWDRYRYYAIPPGLLNPNGENLIAVRVLDTQLDGGMYEGPVGIYHNIQSFERMNAQIGRQQTQSVPWWMWWFDW